PKVQQPIFVINHPLGSAPLAKRLKENPLKLARFLVLASPAE
ncbi:unnamed protein product, partial [marine sediment metagenome]